jgi:predicted nucleotidyltransferase
MRPSKRNELISAWDENLFEAYSIKEIMLRTHKSSKPWVFNNLKHLVKEGLLVSERKGNIGLYSLNWENPLLSAVIQSLRMDKLLSFERLDVISDIIHKVPLRGYCLVVFGSYAEGAQKRDSDMDICFLVDDGEAEKKIRPFYKLARLGSPMELDAHFITYADFIEMLLRDEENLGKQIAMKHQVFYNPDIFYMLLREANRHGYRK